MDNATMIERWKQKLADNIESAKHQMQYAGVRFGVFATLKELERERKRIARRLIQLDPEHELEYAQHLF